MNKNEEKQTRMKTIDEEKRHPERDEREPWRRALV